jgi:uncharacterized membrane protein
MCFSSIRWHHLLCLGVILLVAAGLRIYHLDRNSLWGDEFLSLECSSGWARTDADLAGQSTVAPDLVTLHNARPWTNIWSSMALDGNHPPLYFILLRGWREIFGDSVLSIRSLSVMASIVAIVLLFLVVVTIHSPKAALWACALMALATPQIQQAQDARSYTLMIAACLAAALALVRIERFGPTSLRCAGLCAAALLASLLHYMALATLGAMLLYSLIAMRGANRRGAILSLGGALVLYVALWGPAFLMQHYRMVDATQWMVQHQPDHIRTTLQDFLTLPARTFLDLDLDLDQAPGLCLAGVVFLLPLLVMRRQRAVLLWWIWLVVPVAVVLTIDLATSRRSLGLAKYTIVAAPAVFIMLGLLAAQLKHLGWIPAALVAGCCAICLPTTYGPSTLPDWREISTYIAQRSSPNDPVIFVDSHPDKYCADSLLSVTYYMANCKRPLYVLDRRPTGAVLARLMKSNHACIIADDFRALNAPIVPGLTLDQNDFLPGVALVGTIAPPKATFAVSDARRY